MKRITTVALVLIVALSLYACRMGGNNETLSPTESTTQPETTTPTQPAVTDPIVIDPTIAPNVPDSNVDDDHLVDPTDGQETTPDVRGRLN